MNIREQIKQSGIAMREKLKLSNLHSRELAMQIEIEKLNAKYDRAMYRMWLIVLMSNLVTLLAVYGVLK